MTVGPSSAPLDEAGVMAFTKALLDLDLAPECLPGVLDQLTVLASHKRIVEGRPADTPGA